MALKRACDLKMINDRGIDIEEQVQAKMPKEDHGYGNMVITMSQETENMMSLDIDHTKRIHDDQTKDARPIEDQTQTIIDNQVLRLREVQKLFNNNKESVCHFDSEFNQLVRKYETKVSSNENNGEKSEIEGIYTEKSSKRINQRKGI